MAPSKNQWPLSNDPLSPNGNFEYIDWNSGEYNQNKFELNELNEDNKFDDYYYGVYLDKESGQIRSSLTLFNNNDSYLKSSMPLKFLLNDELDELNKSPMATNKTTVTFDEIEQLSIKIAEHALEING